MSPVPTFADHTITVTEPGSRIVYGSPAPDWSPAKVTTREIGRCYVEPRTTEESESDPDTIRDNWKILIPGYATPPSSQAKIRHPFSPNEYQVIGQVMAQPSVSVGVDHYFMMVERWGTSG